MPTKNIYLREPDTKVWDAAERVAQRRNTSVSRLIFDALTEHLPKVAAEPVPAVRWDEIAADKPSAA